MRTRDSAFGKIGREHVKSSELYVGVPQETTLEQFREIKQSVEKAEKHNIKITLKIEGGNL